MGQLRRAEDDLLAVLVHQVNEAGIAIRNIDRQTNQLLKHLLQAEVGTDNIADLVQQFDLAFVFHDRH